MLQDIWMAPSQAEALKAWNRFTANFKDKYPKAEYCLEKDKKALLTFYDFPASHWRSICTTNPIESIFASVRHPRYRAKGCVSRRTMLAFVFKLIQSAKNKWKRIEGFTHLADVIKGIQFIDGRSNNEVPIDQIENNEISKLAA